MERSFATCGHWTLAFVIVCACMERAWMFSDTCETGASTAMFGLGLPLTLVTVLMYFSLVLQLGGAIALAIAVDDPSWPLLELALGIGLEDLILPLLWHMGLYAVVFLASLRDANEWRIPRLGMTTEGARTTATRLQLGERAATGALLLLLAAIRYGHAALIPCSVLFFLASFDNNPRVPAPVAAFERRLAGLHARLRSKKDD